MLCHKCPHHESIQRGDYSSKPWKDTPCAKCKLGEDTFYSAPFDEEHPTVSAVVSPVVSSFSSEAAGSLPGKCGADFQVCVDLDSDLCPLSSDEMLPADIISSVIQGLLSLDPELRDIVAWRYQGMPYKEIACRQGSSTQLAEMRHKRALRDWPALKALFPEKVAKQARRRKGHEN